MTIILYLYAVDIMKIMLSVGWILTPSIVKFCVRQWFLNRYFWEQRAQIFHGLLLFLQRQTNSGKALKSEGNEKDIKD